MASVYTPPGIDVQELFSPSVTTVLADAAQVCVVGSAKGYKTGVLQVNVPASATTFTINAPDDSVLVQVTAGTQAFVSVKNAVDPTQGSGANQSGYAQGVSADFTVTVTNATTWVVHVVADSDLFDGGTINIVYRYTPINYYEAIRLDSQAAVEARFGPAFNETGVAYPLSHAASLAFENGAATVVCQPLFTLNDPEDNSSLRLTGDPTSTDSWRETMVGLRFYDDINILVPAIGLADSAQIAALLEVQNHIRYMQTQGQYLMMIAGEDSSATLTNASPTVLRSHATTLSDRNDGLTAEQTILVSPSRFKRALPHTSSTVLIGGQYVAAAVAGMIASRPIAATLTRKTIAGIAEVADPRSQGGKNDDAAVGLLVVEQKGGNVQVRHAITLDTTSSARKEISVVRAKHHMIESVRDTLDSQIIGQVPADGNAPALVSNAVIGVLETLRGSREIVDYSGVQSRTLVGDPTRVEVRFSYRPAFPLNYIDIVFSLDLTGGGTTTTTAAV